MVRRRSPVPMSTSFGSMGCWSRSWSGGVFIRVAKEALEGVAFLPSRARNMFEVETHYGVLPDAGRCQPNRIQLVVAHEGDGEEGCGRNGKLKNP